MKKSFLFTMSLVLLALFVSTAANADTIVWGFNAAFDHPVISAIDVDTGTVLSNFVAPNPDAAFGNGRGIAVVGTTIYYSLAGSGKIFITDSVTHADGGVLFDTGLGGVATVAWDGSALWISAYDGTNNAYKYDLAGNKLATVPGFGNFRDGFEVANNNLIANEGDGVGPYDLYDLSGTLITSAFLDMTTVPNFTGITTGVTFNGSNYYVSNPDSFSGGSERILEFSSTGAYMSTISLPDPGPQPSVGWLLEDLSSLGNVPSNPPPSVPEPSTLLLMGVGVAGVGLLRRRFKK